MGTWVVNKGHIQYLVGVALAMELEWQYKGQTCSMSEERPANTPESIGNRLWNANKTAVAVLDKDQQGWFKEPEGEDSLRFNFVSADDIQPIYEEDMFPIYKACLCYEVHASGFNDWKETEF